MPVDAAGAAIRQSWYPDRKTYVRDHLVLAAVGAIAACTVLYFMGNADYWVGLPAAVFAVAVRGWYLASEELTLQWDLTADAVSCSNGRRVPLREITKVRSLGSAVQIITRSGDKHLMKYMSDPGAVKAALARAVGVGVE